MRLDFDNILVFDAFAAVDDLEDNSFFGWNVVDIFNMDFPMIAAESFLLSLFEGDMFFNRKIKETSDAGRTGRFYPSDGDWCDGALYCHAQQRFPAYEREFRPDRFAR